MKVVSAMRQLIRVHDQVHGKHALGECNESLWLLALKATDTIETQAAELTRCRDMLVESQKDLRAALTANAILNARNEKVCAICKGTGVVIDYVPRPFGPGNVPMESNCECGE
jgi:hypothetical protein